MFPPGFWSNPFTIGLIIFGIAVFIVGVIVSIYQYWQERTRKRLVYQVLFNGPLLSVNSAVANQVEIYVLFAGAPIEHARLLILNIINDGKTPIHASDYFDPLSFEFNANVLEATVLETTPPTLINPSKFSYFLTLTQRSVQFPPFPLNSGDSMQISILLDGKSTLRVTGRLAQGTIERLPPEKSKLNNLSVALLILFGLIIGTYLAVLIIFLFTTPAAIPSALPVFLPPPLTAIIGLALGFYSGSRLSYTKAQK